MGEHLDPEGRFRSDKFFILEGPKWLVWLLVRLIGSAPNIVPLKIGGQVDAAISIAARTFRNSDRPVFGRDVLTAINNLRSVQKSGADDGG